MWSLGAQIGSSAFKKVLPRGWDIHGESLWVRLKKLLECAFYVMLRGIQNV